MFADATEGTLLEALIGLGPAAALGRRPLAELLDAPGAELARWGLGAASRRRVQAVAEVARRHQPELEPACPITAPRHALAKLRWLRGRRSEVLAVLLLDARMCALGSAAVARGAVAHVGATPREVFAPALRRGASAVVLAHNHPSGKPDPSAEDREFTETMVEAGRLLEIEVLDHLVVARRGYYSFREAGLM